MMFFDRLKRWADIREGYWFAPKLFGLGATPVTWQGWALVLGTIALVLLDLRFVERPAARIIVAAVLILGLVVISWRKTDGGWRWHWGLPD